MHLASPTVNESPCETGPNRRVYIWNRESLKSMKVNTLADVNICHTRSYPLGMTCHLSPAAKQRAFDDAGGREDSGTARQRNHVEKEKTGAPLPLGL